MILITGHPRSGTGYVSKLCQAYGLDVRHEELGANGISSWLFTPFVNYRPPFNKFEESRQDLMFSHVFGVIRHPFDIIASTAYTEVDAHSWHWRKSFVFIDESRNIIEQSAMSVIGWYKLLDAQGIKCYKIEEIEETIKFLSDGFKRNNVEKGYNSRPHSGLSKTELKMAVSQGVYNEVINLCKSYNYE